MANNSVRSRFVFSVGSNLFRALLSFSTGMLLGRYLGPKDYGNMSFLIGTFMGVRQLLDLGSSTAFFTFISQKIPSRRFVNSFLVWLLLQFLLPLLFIGLLFPVEWINSIWHDNDRWIVLLAFTATFMQNSVWPIFQNSGESQRQTHWVQTIGILVSLTHLIAIILLWKLGVLALYAIFIAIAFEYIIASVVASRRFNYSSEIEISDTPKLLFSKYWLFCLPLIPYSVFNFLFEFVDKWMLQSNGGSVQQAYYAVGMQLCSISLIATTSIIRIFWKEIAEANYRGDHTRMGMLYIKISRFLFLTASIITGFLVPWTEDILIIILGSSYAGGAATLAIMFFYPIHQSLGQINGILLIATERIKLQAIGGIIFMIVSILTSYFVLASKDSFIPGLGLGSIGLALKMVVMQFLEVNIFAFVISRIFKWHFDWSYQFISILVCLTLGWITHFLIISLTNSNLPQIFVIGLAGVVYSFLIGALIFLRPQLAGITHNEIKLFKDKLLRRSN